MCDLHQPLVSPTQIQRHDLVLVARRGHLPRRCARVARSSEPPQRHCQLQPLKESLEESQHIYLDTYDIHMYVYIEYVT